MKPPKFHVGQAVAFIGEVDKPEMRQFYIEGNHLQVGGIYHISVNLDFSSIGAGWVVQVREVPKEIGWFEECFTPVEELPAEALAELLEETLPAHAVLPV